MKSLPFLAVVSAFAGLVLLACSPEDPESAPDSSGTTAAAPTASSVPTPAPAPSSPAVRGLRFEKLLGSTTLPFVAVEVKDDPTGPGFFCLGRDGHLFHWEVEMEDLPELSRPNAKGYFPPQTHATAKVRVDDNYSDGDLGVIGMDLDPDFAENRFVYVWKTDKPDLNLSLVRLCWNGTEEEILASRVEVIGFSRREPPKPYHMGGIVQFLPDGTLLVGVGDAERPELSQDRKDLNGKFLRIAPRKGPEGGYDVPADNPFVGDDTYAPEIFATGLRAPFRATLLKGRYLFFGDVGSEHEEIDVLDVTKGGVNFGWGIGHNTDGYLKRDDCVEPLVTWTKNDDFSLDDDRYQGEQRVAAGVGTVYEPDGNDRYHGFLTGKLLWHEVMRGWLRAAELTPEMGLGEHRHIGHLPFVGDVHQGKDGYLYFLTWGPGSALYRAFPDEVDG
ncbi:MAG: PQQ-dependent sugar dehydrogenase [Planctomycetota bacterium]